jgi:hypothetical protein
MVVDHNPDTWSVPVNARQLRRVSFSRDGPVAVFIMPDVVRPDTARNEIRSAFVPDPFPAVE